MKSIARRILLVGIGMPSLLTVIFLILQLSWLDELPAQVATHWSLNGADGFGSPNTYIFLTALIAWLLPIIITLSALHSVKRKTISTLNLRFLVGTGLWISALFGLAFTLSLEIQRGLTDVSEVSGIEKVLLWSICIASIYTAFASFLVPAVQRKTDNFEKIVPLKLRQSETVLWLKETKMGTGARWMLRGVNIVMLITAIWFGSTGQWMPFLILLLSTVITVLATLSATRFTVRIDETGLQAYSPLKFPRFEVDLEEIRSVAVRDVDVFAEFGGWGVRSRLGVKAVALRSGPALVIERKKKSDLVITVPDAKQGAEVLQGLLVR